MSLLLEPAATSLENLCEICVKMNSIITDISEYTDEYMKPKMFQRVLKATTKQHSPKIPHFAQPHKSQVKYKIINTHTADH